jgi:hypothetical protein
MWALPRSLYLPSCSYGCSSSRSPVPELTRGAGIQLNERVSLLELIEIDNNNA